MLAAKDELFTRPSGGYTIARSVRLRSSASAYFNRTFGSPTNAIKWTWSGWVKRGALPGTNMSLFQGYASSSTRTSFGFLSSNAFWFNGVTVVFQTNAVARDPSGWYHIVIVYDSANATQANRLICYVNGVQQTFSSVTYPTLNQVEYINASGAAHYLGADFSPSLGGLFDGYLTEINFIDGQALTPSSFGSTNAITGVWQPAKYTGTYGTNGFYLNFSDNSNNTATTIGKDYSGNGNNWTPNNISVTAGATYDSMTDVPTLTSATAANYPVMNPLNTYSSITVGNANLQLTITEAAYRKSVATMAFPASGKCYVEANTSGGTDYFSYGIVTPDAPLSDAVGNTATGYGVITSTTNWDRKNNGTTSGNFWTTPTLPTSATLQIAVDTTNGKLWIGYNNVWLDGSGGLTGNPSAGTNATFTIDTTRTYLPSFGGYKSNSVIINFNAGQRPFSYTPPTGFVALNTYNLPASTITNGAAYMAATTYTGNLTGQSITNGGNNTLGTTFQPDLVWIKSRSAATDNKWTDSVRGATKALISNTTGAETTDTTGVTALNSNGFTLGVSTVYNNVATTYVAWQWKAGGTSASNTNGTITSTVSANPTAGFSVVTYTGTGANATVGHGLGVAPSMIILKQRNAVDYWVVWQTALGSTGYLLLNSTNGSSTAATYWNSTTPTSTVFSLGSDSRPNGSGTTYVAYCFAAVAGYSAFGSYVGNGSNDGPFVYTGFRPRFLLIKNTTTAGTNWEIWDSARDLYNVESNRLYPDSSAAENGGQNAYDFLSNGFKARQGGATDSNQSGATIIYAAFAENPFRNALAR